MQDKQQSVILKNHTELFGGFFRRISGQKSHLILAVSNILLILGAVIFTVVYSKKSLKCALTHLRPPQDQ